MYTEEDRGLAKYIEKEHVYNIVTELVEYLLEDDEEGLYTIIANNQWCPKCMCKSNHCTDEMHDSEKIRVKSWHMVSEELCKELEKEEEITLAIDDISAYFWGHSKIIDTGDVFLRIAHKCREKQWKMG
jgi:hypothetical protein